MHHHYPAKDIAEFTEDIRVHLTGNLEFKDDEAEQILRHYKQDITCNYVHGTCPHRLGNAIAEDMANKKVQAYIL